MDYCAYPRVGNSFVFIHPSLTLININYPCWCLIHIVIAIADLPTGSVACCDRRGNGTCSRSSASSASANRATAGRPPKGFWRLNYGRNRSTRRNAGSKLWHVRCCLNKSNHPKNLRFATRSVCVCVKTGAWTYHNDNCSSKPLDESRWRIFDKVKGLWYFAVTF